MKNREISTSFRPSALLLPLLLLFLFVSCKKKDPVPAGPGIELTEVGSGNSKQAYIGDDLHLEGMLTAEALIREIEIDIRPKVGSYEITRKYLDGKYIGVREVEFHEHIDIPGDAPAGAYLLRLTVTDRQGKTASATADLQLIVPEHVH